MNGLYDVARHLVWLTQFGLSVVVPPTLCIAGSVWLRHRFTLGGWVVAVGVVVGVLAAVSCLRGSLQALDGACLPNTGSNEQTWYHGPSSMCDTVQKGSSSLGS